MTKLQRRIWVSAVGLLATLIVLAGLAVGAFRIAVQLVPGYRAEVASRVESLIGSPVQIDDMDLIWRGRFPTLQLRGVEVGAQPASRLGLDELSLGFAVTRLLRGDITPERISLRGTRLQLVRENGQFLLGGLNTQSEPGQTPQQILQRLQRVGQVQWRDTHVRWTDRDAQRPSRDIVITRLDSQRESWGLDIELQLQMTDQPGSDLAVQAQLESGPWQVRGLKLQADSWQPWPELAAYFPSFPALTGQLQYLQLDTLWQAGQWQSADLQLRLKDFKPQAATRGIAQLNAQAQLQRQPSGGVRASVDLQELTTALGAWPQQNLLLRWQPHSPQRALEYSLSMEYLRLDDLQVWAHLLPAEWAQRLHALQPGGELRGMVVQSPVVGQVPQFTGELHALNLQADGKIPGVSGLSGVLSFSQGQGRIQLDSQRLQLDAPRLFAQPLHLDELSGALSWQQTDQGWKLDAPGLHYAGMNLDGVGRLQLELGEQTHMDLDLNFFCSDVLPWLAYQPLNWSPNLRNWLSGAIGGARVAAGQVRIQGNLADFPFRDRNKGQFVVDLDLEQAALKFASDWPRVDVSQARLLIDAASLRVDAGAAQLGGVKASSAMAEIADLKQSELVVEADVAGDAKTIWGVLSASGLRQHLAGLFDSLDLSGPVDGHLRLDLPLRELHNSRYAVDVALDKAALWTRFWPDPIQKIRGHIQIDDNGLRARKVQAAVAGIPVEVDLTPDQGVTRIAAKFAASAQQLPTSVPLPKWLIQRASGQADFRLDMQVGENADNLIKVHSPMLGMVLDLPRPFGKRKEQLRALDVRITPDTPGRVHISYADKLGLDLLLADSGQGVRAARLTLGGDAPPAGAPGWWVEGGLEQADFDAWLPLVQDLSQELAASSVSSQTADAFGGLVLRVDELNALGQRLPDTRLQLTQADDVWRLGLSGPRANGTLFLSTPAKAQRLHVRGEFDNMNWTRAIEVQSQDIIDPNEIPALDVSVKNFALNDIALGQFKLQLQPVKRGLRIAQATIDTQQRRELDISGLWLRDSKGSSAAMDFSMDTENFSSWLSILGYRDNLIARRGQLNGQLSWAPDPQGLNFSTLSGKLDFDFSDGQLLNIEPGAGRVLGLFSVNALPRRFFLDFSDVVNTGLAFDELSGHFELENGLASTDNLQVKGPSVRIGVRGQVDLVKREYDQVVTIYPGISSGVSLAATVLGGPVVGLVTLLAQELLDQPLDQVSQIGYHLGGSWDNPKVSRLQ